MSTAQNRLLDQVRRLRQCNEDWEVICRLARTWITPRNQTPYRPYHCLVVNQNNAILRSELSEQAISPEQLFQEILNAMLHPLLGSGRRRRPNSFFFDNPDYVAALTSPLGELDIGCQLRSTLPTANFVLTSLTKQMNRGKLIPGLLSIPGVTVPLVGNLFQLAADFHRATPWQYLNDLDPMEIASPPNANPRYAVVMGSGGEVFGLAVYDSLKDLKLAFEPQVSHRQLTQKSSWLVLFFEISMAMSFDDLDAINQYNWPVSSQNAYPVFGRTNQSGEVDLPTRADLLWMETALAGILKFLPECEDGYPQVTRKTLTIQTISGSTKLRLKVPAFEHDSMMWML